jgi:CVNH domain
MEIKEVPNIEAYMLKRISSLVLVVMLCFSLLTANAWASGKYSATCENIKLSGSTLSATCKTLSGASKETSIDLNKSIANLDGSLSWDGSNFAATSRKIALVNPNKLAAESAKKDSKTYVPTSINVDEHIANLDGFLTYQ